MFEVVQAKTKESTLLLNGKYIYSKYQPKKDAQLFIEQQCNEDKSSYLLIGLGLGYHLEALLRKTGNKIIYVLLCEVQEKQICIDFKKFEKLPHVNFIQIHEIKSVKFDSNMQVIVPYSIINSLNFEHPVREMFEHYKLNEMSFVQYDQVLEENFQTNLLLGDPTIKDIKNLLRQPAILVSAGPSIDTTIAQIKKLKSKVFILAVGSALRILKSHNIDPDAIIWSDAKQVGIWHLHELHFEGPMFYLATASKEVVSQHKGKRFMMFQKNYALSEHLAVKKDVETFEVGGSVATAAFSFLEYIGATEIVLCGQDLGFKEGKTHSQSTFSGVQLNQDYLYREIPANDDGNVKVSKSLYSYFKWFDKHVPLSAAKVYNTAFHGAKITGAEYLSPTDFYEMYKNLPVQDFSNLFEVR